ncbi:MAG: DUF3891 family protein [Pirellulales bacterium]|nr:DUF3891 family protein [Pirellulales bacterium]
MTIIRDMPIGGADGWVLLSQVEHARISGEIAAAWSTPALVPRDAIVAAVFHHDDGWADWEEQPRVDPATGKPHPFTDMPDDAKLEIWRKSIDAARALGPLEGTIVARHFIGLEQGTNRWQKTEGTTDDEAQAFVDRYAALADEWLSEWMDQSPSHTQLVAQTAREWLQLFDVLSLWLCMAERTEAKHAELPGGGEVVLTPLSANRIAIDPWPFAQPSLTLQITGRRVPARRYRDTADLNEEISSMVELSWVLVRGKQ